MDGTGELVSLLDRVAALRAAGNLEPLPADGPDAPGDPVARQVRWLLSDRQLRREHRARIYDDLVRHRDLLLRRADPRMVDLVYWSEQVERLHAGLRRGRVSTFHYARALEATCRRCGYDMLSAVGRMDELGRAWGGRDYAATCALLSSDVVQVDPPAETA